MRYLVPGPMPCPEVVTISYIRPAKVLTLFSVEGDTQVKQKNHKCGFLTTLVRTPSLQLGVLQSLQGSFHLSPILLFYLALLHLWWKPGSVMDAVFNCL